MGIYQGHFRMCDKLQHELLRSMELSIKFETVKSGRSIFYIEGFHKNITFLTLKIEFV